MNFTQVLRAAPIAPACFTQDTWVAYLCTAHQHSKPKNQPFRTGIYRPEFNFCADCTLEHSVLMSRSGRCQPSALRILLTTTQEACSHE